MRCASAHRAAPRVAPQNTGTSLVETFTDPQIVEHIEQIRLGVQQQQARNAQGGMQLPPVNPADACAVCNCIKLLFEPPLVYCTSCGQKIKRSQVFYCTTAEAGGWPPRAQARAPLLAPGCALASQLRRGPRSAQRCGPRCTRRQQSSPRPGA